VSLMDLLYWFGGKRPLRNEIIPFLVPLIKEVREFREPFCGSAAIALPLMSLYPNRIFWINDRDPAVACVWFAVKHYPDQMIELAGSFRPDVNDFRRFRATIATTFCPPTEQKEIVEVAFCILAVQYMCWSGWGVGVRGGYHQRFDRIGERWSPELTIRKIRFLHRRLNRVETRITAFDFGRLVEETEERALLYCDPPYIRAGSQYRYGFSSADHERLAEILRRTPHHWLLSYGDHPEVHRMYQWARIERIAEKELLIMPMRVSY
jgi:DNA adenine methylase